LPSWFAISSIPRVGAVAGNTKVGNRINLLTRWQALEYITSQNLDRRAFDVLNCITVVPGAVGAWRRELVERAGGFRTTPWRKTPT
jgi:cellulose synthase/poly-beta-1,6-N-acetylglucosamine synthase-like glycosyltransferase